MQYLGEFLSPQNNISKDQDQLVKYFYFRPDRYDDPDADLENIFIIKNMAEFPKRLDRLAENPLYAIESIDVSKRLSDEELGVKNVSYVVTATYDLYENIKNREDSGGGGGSSSESDNSLKIDEDGNKVEGTILPWKERAKWDFQPVELTVPFTKAYVPNGTSWDEPTVNVVNSAGTIMPAETRKYQLEITYTKNYQSPQEWENISQAVINSKKLDFNFDYRGSFPSGTLLMIPPTYSRNWIEVEEIDDDGKVTKELKDYWTYTIKMIYDKDGHDKVGLDAGTYAKFGSDPTPSQIWEVTIADANTGALIGEPKWVSASEALKEQAMAIKTGRIVNASPITEPVPLKSTGEVDSNALANPTIYSYRTLRFTQYPGRDFTVLPFKN